MSDCPALKVGAFLALLGAVMLISGSSTLGSVLVRSLSSSRRLSSSIKRYGVATRYSESVVANGMVYTSGQVGGGANIKEATAAALKDLDTALSLAGVDKSRLVSVTVYLKNIADDYAGMNEVWEAWLVPGQPPARATVQALLADPTWLVEVSGVAAVE